MTPTFYFFFRSNYIALIGSRRIKNLKLLKCRLYNDTWENKGRKVARSTSLLQNLLIDTFGG